MFNKLNAFSRGHKKLCLIVALFVGFTAFRLISSAASPFASVPPGQEAVYVQLGEAKYGTMRELSFYHGTLSAPNRFFLAPKVGGELKEILVDIGDRLQNGDLVALLDDEEYVLARDRAKLSVTLAEAQLSEARANLELAQSDMSRQLNLSQKSIVTQSDYENAVNRLLQAEARLNVATSQLNGALNQLADAELKLSYTRVSAAWPPVEERAEGDYRYVGSRLADGGTLLTANSPILDVVSLDPLLVVVDVIEKDYPKIQVGMEATIRTEAYPDRAFPGKILRIAPVLSTDSRQARVELEVANPALALKPGMFAEVVFVFSQREGVWSVEADVPFRRHDGYVLFVADPVTSTVSERRVSLGIREGSRVEVSGGGPIDGPVVTLGQHLLRDGQVYRLPEASLAPAEGGGENRRPGELPS